VTKTYDGTLAASGTAVVTSGTLYNNVSNGNVTDSISGGTFAFTNANAGSGNKTVTVSGVTVTDGNSGNNYSVSYANNTTSTINKANITISTSDVTKTYDGTLAASGTAVVTSGTLYNNASNGNVKDSISGGTFAFTNANAGSGNRTVTVSGVTVTDGNSGNNYSVSYANNTTSTINKANITISTSDVTKTYDGTLAASGTAVVTSGTLYNNASNGNVKDSISGGTFAFTNANAGSGNRTVTVSGVTVTDGNSGNNYSVSYANNTTSTINKANITISTSDVTKTYDGTLAASGTAVVTSGTLYNNASNGNVKDSISGGTFAFMNANAGSGNKTVTVSGVTVTDGNSGNNYSVSYANNTTSTINKRPVNLTGSRVYDSTNIVDAGIFTISNLIDGQTLALSGSGTLANKNVVTNGVVTPGTLTLQNGSGLASNYTLTGGTHVATITPATLTINAVAQNKVYDGTTSATITFSDNRFSGDQLIVSGTAVYSDKNAGTGKTVQVTGISLSGTGQGNYIFNTTTATTADITRKPLTISSFSASNKVYDSTTDAIITGGSIESGVITGDDVSISQITGTFSDKNAGAGKIVKISGGQLGGTDGGNYSITSLDTTTADITPRPLTITPDALTRIYGNANPVYDTMTGDNLASGDVLGASTVSATATERSGIGTYVLTPGAASFTSGSSSNYTITYASGTLTIVPRSLTISGISAENKVYDGTTTSTVNTSSVVYTGLLSGDDVTVSATGAFENKNAGNQKTVVLTSSYNGDAMDNYIITGQNTATADITPAVLTVAANNDSRNYTGAIYSGGNGVTYTGFIAGETTADLNGALTYGGTSQGAVNAGEYVITPYGFSSGNYKINYASGLLTINVVSTEGVTNAVESSATSEQASFNGTIQSLNGGTDVQTAMVMGPGSGSSSLADFSTTNFISLADQTTSTMTITSTTSSSVNYKRSGNTSTLHVGAEPAGDATEDAGSLSVFSREEDGTIVPKGSYIVKEGPSCISLTEAAASHSYSLDETGIYSAKMVSFTMNLANGTNVRLETAFTDTGMLVIFASKTISSLDMDQAILMAMEAVHKEMNIEFKQIKTVLLNRQKG
jgi:trimeric autotransporter adhesin